MSPDMMVITDLDGRQLAGEPHRKPSSEILMHLVAYRHRPDVNAVVHAHPPSPRVSPWPGFLSIARCWQKW